MMELSVTRDAEYCKKGRGSTHALVRSNDAINARASLIERVNDALNERAGFEAGQRLRIGP